MSRLNGAQMVVLESKNYAIGVMGRSGSTNMIKLLTGSNSRKPWQRDFSYFNERLHKEKYVVIRNPLDRWKSAKNSGVPLDEFHALPWLSEIGWSDVSGIIPFEDISNYIGERKHYRKIDIQTAHSRFAPPLGLLDSEMIYYKMYRRHIPVLTPNKFMEIKKEWDY